jgi:magnesium chelatase family protein
LLDRIDMQIEVCALPSSDLIRSSDPGESSQIVRARVENARHVQLNRAERINAHLSLKALEQFCSLSPALQTLLEARMKKLGLSARSYHRVLRLARTIADLEQYTALEEQHLLEALNYRKFERHQITMTSPDSPDNALPL